VCVPNMMYLKTLALPCFVTLAHASDILSGRSDMATVEISLAPPSHPALSAEIGSLDAAREDVESVMVGQVRQAAQAALEAVQGNIDAITRNLVHSSCEDPGLKAAFGRSLIGRPHRGSVKSQTLAFLSQSSRLAEDEAIVDVGGLAEEVHLPHGALQNLENHRGDAERKFFQKAIAEMGDLSTSIAADFQAEVDKQLRGLLTASRPVGFLQQADVKVVASEGPYPTIVSLVGDMERRRDVAETLAQRQLALSKLMLIQGASAAARQSLEAAVSSIVKCLSK